MTFHSLFDAHFAVIEEVSLKVERWGIFARKIKTNIREIKFSTPLRNIGDSTSAVMTAVPPLSIGMLEKTNVVQTNGRHCIYGLENRSL